MDETIEMKDRDFKEDELEGEEETSFIDWDSSYLEDFSDNPEMLKAFQTVLERNVPSQNVMEESIQLVSLTDNLNWDVEIRLSDALNTDEWRKKVDDINAKIGDELIVDYGNVKAYHYLENNEFDIEEYREKVLDDARSKIVAEMKIDEPESLALDYIYEMREEQKKAKNIEEVKEIEKEISLLKNNDKNFKIRWKVFKRTTPGRLRKLLSFLWRHKSKIGPIGGMCTLILSILGYFLSLGFDRKVNRTLKNINKKIEDIPKNSAVVFYPVITIGAVIPSILWALDSSLSLFETGVALAIGGFLSLIVYIYEKIQSLI